MWQTIRINYWAETRHRLLLAGVRPVVERLARTGAIERYWVDTHWKQGPHIRLHLIGTDEAIQTIQAEVGAYLAAHPSRRRLDEAALRPVHEGLAQIEFEEGPLFPFRPDNTVEVIPYPERPRMWGSAQTAAIAAQCRAEAAPLMWELLEMAGGSLRRRLSIAVSLMIAAVGARGRLQKDVLCFRSHIEGFLAEYDSDGSVRGSFGDWYEGNEEWLAGRIGRLFDGVQGQRQIELYVARWMELVRSWHDRFESAFAEGEARFFSRADLAEVTAEFQPQSSGGSSEYHRFMYSFQSVNTYAESARFHAFRYTVNLTYNCLVLLGLRPVERYGLCYAITRRAEAYWTEPWWQLVTAAAGVEPPFIPRGSVHAG